MRATGLVTGPVVAALLGVGLGALSVTVLRDRPVARLRAVTVAPATGWPSVPRTVPRTAAVVSCAWTGAVPTAAPTLTEAMAAARARRAKKWEMGFDAFIARVPSSGAGGDC